MCVSGKGQIYATTLTVTIYPIGMFADSQIPVALMPDEMVAPSQDALLVEGKH